MLTLIPFDADAVIGLRVEGKISAAEFEDAKKAIEERFGRHEKISLYAEILSFGGISLEALLKDIKFSLGHWIRFEKEVIVTDKSWLHKVGFAADKVFPGMEVKVFPIEEREGAQRYVSAAG
jgi:hypothetical protein